MQEDKRQTRFLWFETSIILFPISLYSKVRGKLILGYYDNFAIKEEKSAIAFYVFFFVYKMTLSSTRFLFVAGTPASQLGLVDSFVSSSG